MIKSFFLSTVLILVWLVPSKGEEPINTNTLLKSPTQNSDSGQVYRSSENEIKEKKNEIERSLLEVSNLNSVGIIPTNITGIDPNIWFGIDETILYQKFKSLSNLRFHSAQTFLKRILISETNPPISVPGFRQTGKFYLLAKLDKLIKLGALDEAETAILQVPRNSRDLFERWAKIAFLTGRLTKLCETLKKNPGLTKELSIRIMCLVNQNDWNAAALTLSTAANLKLLNSNREKLLIYYLNPDLLSIKDLSWESQTLDEIDNFILRSAREPLTKETNKPEHKYLAFKNGLETFELVPVAEALAIQKSLNISSLFDIYRNSSIKGGNGFWQRVIAIKNLDLTLNRDNDKSVSIALNHTIKTMHSANLLSLFAVEYADRLSRFSSPIYSNDFKDALAVILVLNGSLPPDWQNFTSENRFLNTAVKISNKKNITQDDIYNAVNLVAKNFFKDRIIHSKPINRSQLKAVPKNKGDIILTALESSAPGVATLPDDLYSSLVPLLMTEEEGLIKSILIEYLIHFALILPQD